MRKHVAEDTFHCPRRSLHDRHTSSYYAPQVWQGFCFLQIEGLWQPCQFDERKSLKNCPRSKDIKKAQQLGAALELMEVHYKAPLGIDEIGINCINYIGGWRTAARWRRPGSRVFLHREFYWDTATKQN